jgi:thiamine biosynthesis protein ThiC
MMSKLDELIAKLCPDGVEYKTIHHCIEREQLRKLKKSNVEKIRHPVCNGG